MNGMEILAPAGNIQALKAAVANGANAVYLGLSEFSARAKADNFALDNLKDAVDYAHMFNVKIYVAMNTLIKNNELEKATELCLKAYKYGVDALIIQDLSLSTKLQSIMPDIVLHASTQMGIHNLDGARIAQKMGFKRIILSREAVLGDIQAIRQNTDLEIEAFVQGALCVSFSGNCYFSSLVSGYSGNRGRCMQLCRKPYTIDGKTAYWLSPADLYMAKNINQLIDCGVTSFKIEGRLRRAEYVAEAVRVYRNALDGKLKEDDLNDLKKVFNRGDYCTAHYKDKTANIIYKNLQGHKGLEIGVVKTIKNGKALILNRKGATYNLHEDDGLKFLRNGLEVGSASVKYNGSDTTYVGDVKVGDSVHITTDTQANLKINNRVRKLLVEVDVKMNVGLPPTAILTCGNTMIAHVGNFNLEFANNQPLSDESIIQCFEKSGELFDAKVNVATDNVFIARSVLNDFRRNAYKALEVQMLRNYMVSSEKSQNSTTNHSTVSDIIHQKYKLKDNFTMLQVETVEQLSPKILAAIDYIVVNPLEYNIENIAPFYEMDLSQQIFLNIPNVVRGRDRDVLKKILEDKRIKNVIVNNIGGLELCKDKNIVLGIGMNILNDDVLCPHIQSIESDKINNDSIVYAYGYAPLMTFCHCPVKVARGCSNCNFKQAFHINDDRGNKFYIRRYRIDACYSQLINSVPINLLNRQIGKKFIDVTNLNVDEMEKVICATQDKLMPIGRFTVGNIDKVLY